MLKEVTNEELARMIAKGFEETASKTVLHRLEEKVDNLEKHATIVDNRLDHLDARMGRMEADLNEIKGNIVYKFEFEDLASRVKLIESKLGIESGK